MNGRPLTDFERERGYYPCKLWLGEPRCGVNVGELRRAGRVTICAGTIEECRNFGNEQRFAGQPVPGHPVAEAVLANVPTVIVTHDDE